MESKWKGIRLRRMRPTPIKLINPVILIPQKLEKCMPSYKDKNMNPF